MDIAAAADPGQDCRAADRRGEGGGTDGTGEASDGDARAPTDFVASAANSENADNAEGAAATEGTPSTAAAADDAMVSATIAAEAEAEAKAEAEKAKAAGSQGAVSNTWKTAFANLGVDKPEESPSTTAAQAIQAMELSKCMASAPSAGWCL